MSAKSEHIKAEASARLEKTEYLKTDSNTVVTLKTYEAIGIEPRMLIQQPELKLINSSLAYEFSDRQTEVGYFISFITLFLGVGISSIISLTIALQSDPLLETMVAIHSSVVALSLIVAGIFGVLTKRALKKANNAKVLMDSHVGVSELKLRIVDDGINSPD